VVLVAGLLRAVALAEVLAHAHPVDLVGQIRVLALQLDRVLDLVAQVLGLEVHAPIR
jgi:hypothetical protein